MKPSLTDVERKLLARVGQTSRVVSRRLDALKKAVEANNKARAVFCERLARNNKI